MSIVNRMTKVMPVRNEIVLMHIGQPWTEYYAKIFLRKRLTSFYNIPRAAAKFMPDNLLINDKIRRCINVYGGKRSLEEQIDDIGSKVESNLNRMMPEEGEFKVSKMLDFDKIEWCDRFEMMRKNRSQRFIFMPLYSHYNCGESGILLSKVAKSVLSCSEPGLTPSERIELGTDYSYNISAIHRFNYHPFISEFWAEQLNSYLGSFEEIVFIVPRKTIYNKDYYASVWSTCERISSLLNDCLPWKIAFYNSWDSWNIPNYKRSLKSVIKCTEKKVVLVPVTELMETFDTISVLPDIVEKMNNVTLLDIRNSKKEKIVSGLTEVIKNHLMGRKNCQLEVECDHCCRSDCKSRVLFI